LPNSSPLTTDAPEVELSSVKFRLPPDSETFDAYIGTPFRTVPLFHAYHSDVSRLVPLNSDDQTSFQLPGGPSGCTDAGGVTCVGVGLGVGPGVLLPTGEVLGAGELLLPDDGDADVLLDGLDGSAADGDGLGLMW
jgi:hypothetical protein